MTDARSQAREGCLIHGQISAPELHDAVDCTIWDISPDGAKLILPDGATLPDRITITTPFSLRPRQAQVCWRGGNEAGIRLLAEDKSAIDDLAQQNAELAARLRSLQRQLEQAEARASAPATESVRVAAPLRDRAFSYVLDDEVRILVTDDDPILREFARVHLTTPTASVEAAESGEEGLQCLSSSHFDIALIDLEMPGMGGLEMIKRLRADPAHCDLPVIVVTGREDVRSIDLAYEVGATSFVTKPVNWRLMSYQLRYVLRAQRSYRGCPIHGNELALAG